DSIWVKHYAYSSSTLDAYGDLTLPTGTHEVLRQSGMEESIDSVYIYVTNAAIASFLGVPASQWVMSPIIAGVIDENPIIDTTFIYKWIANGEKHPLVDMRTDAPNGNIISLEYQVGGAVLVTLVPTYISCPTMCDGAITVTPTVGISPFTYAWDNGETSSNITGLCSGTYSVTVIDALNDTAFSALTLNDPTPISTQISGGYVQCAGDINTGVIDVTTIGGTSPFSYMWDNGASTATITGLGLNTYSLSITDANACFFDTAFTIMNPDTIETTLITPTVLCFGDSTSVATVTATGGLTPYFYNWSDGALTDSSNALSAGAISVTITNVLGCTKITSSTITENDSLSYTIGIALSGGCSGYFEMYGGQSPYTYLWSNGDTTQQSCDAADYYSITMTDANGCSIVVDSVQVYTGIEGYSFGKISIYPNPTTGIFTIELENNNTTQVSIQDITGKEVFATIIEEAQYTIDISHLKSGNYLLRLSNNKGTMNRKLIPTK
ncbi:MAG: T9SS type A sorting domain-containing protein, partial [Flavobacteriales bacterium]|nr:T9SS type A sorting domain-containing protein [Flavobacteriales bacterium]